VGKQGERVNKRPIEEQSKEAGLGGKEVEEIEEEEEETEVN
jgi:hypothetical protein